MPWAKANLFYGTNASRTDEHLLTTMSTTPENIAKVCEAILADRRQTIHDVCAIVGLSYGTVQRITADNMNMRRISTRFVPRLLSDDQKALRVSVCRELKQARDDPNFISNIVTGDETWVYDYDRETKQQSSQWKSPNSPRPKKARQVRSIVESMLIFFFFDIQGIVHKEFVPPGKTVNGKFYCEGLKRLREGIRRKRPDNWKKTIGFSTITTHPLTHHSLFDISWRPKTLQWFPTPSPSPIRLTSPPANFSCSPRWNYGWKGVVLTRLRRSTQKRTMYNATAHRLPTHHNNRIPYAVKISVSRSWWWAKYCPKHVELSYRSINHCCI